jgi:methylated-DNA-[protein]-cysteine S-methyltransferase
VDTCLRSATVTCPIGELLLVASSRGLVQVFLPSSKGVPATTEARHDPAAHCLPEARRQLHEFFYGSADGWLQSFDLPLDEKGSAFQLRVWAALREIPYGTTCSYGDIAGRVGADPRTASRAVGIAGGSNLIAVVTPCHRVVGAGGDLVGYAGGLHAKRWLLDHEAGTVGALLF